MNLFVFICVVVATFSTNGHVDSAAVGSDVTFHRHAVDLTSTDLIWKDKGSGARYDFSCWAPRNTRLGYVVGHFGSKSHSQPSDPYVVSVSGRSESDVFKKPIGYSRIWKDSGSGAYSDGSFWEVNCPFGYGSLSDLCQKGYSRPSINDVWCVKNTYLDNEHRNNWIWDDRRSGAYSDVDINGGNSRHTKRLISATTRRGQTKSLNKISSVYL